MAETEQSYIFDFSRVPTFFQKFNVCRESGQSTPVGFKIADMDGSSLTYELVICQNGGDNIDDYLDQNGLLDDETIDPQGELL